MKNKNQKNSKEFPLGLIFAMLKPCIAVGENYQDSKEAKDLFSHLLGIDFEKDKEKLTDGIIAFCLKDMKSQHPEIMEEFKKIGDVNCDGACKGCIEWAQKNKDKTIAIQPIDPEKVKEAFEKRDSGITIIEIDVFSFPNGLSIGVIR